MKVSRMSKLNRNQIKNMIHVIGIENIIPTEGLHTSEGQDLVENVVNIISMVPSTEKHSGALKKDYAIYCARILRNRLVTMFDKMGLHKYVCKHIQHAFSSYMAKRSNTVCMIDDR